MLYADTSALARVYLPDEPNHVELRRLLLDSGEQVVTCELARLELASAVQAAHRAGRLAGGGDVLLRIDADCGPNGSVKLLTMRPEFTFVTAHRLLLQHRLRTLDAIHLAVALDDAPALADGEEVVFVTRDAHQAAAARALGLAVR